ncbi:MAG: DNA repair protein RadC [Armatimonadota bacterium]|nr:DNA repair protein RadC [bacterium]MDW8321666.1 DNA repair protein RadC [Armatimonadota bacterium]
MSPQAQSIPDAVKYTIKELPEDERPRERLVQFGASALSSAELLAILLRTGTPEMTAVQLAQHLLATMGSLRAIANAKPAELAQLKGIGVAKAAQLLAAVELGRRIALEQMGEQPVITRPDDVYALLHPQLRDEKQEHVVVLLLNTRNRVMRQTTVTKGTLDASLLHPREVFREAVRHSASSIILAHNHPSGDPTPSSEDIQITRRLHQAGQIMGIDLLDHVILGDGRWVSLKAQGMI